jgi:hypothetical protein
MPTFELTNEQVLKLVKQLPPKRQRAALAAGGEERAERGLDWDKMTENQREAIIDDLVHADRACRRQRCSTPTSYCPRLTGREAVPVSSRHS